MDNTSPNSVLSVKEGKIFATVVYPDNCIVMPKNEVIEILKQLEGIKRKFQPLLKKESK
jgi:hypothetical protein